MNQIKNGNWEYVRDNNSTKDQKTATGNQWGLQNIEKSHTRGQASAAS